MELEMSFSQFMTITVLKNGLQYLLISLYQFQNSTCIILLWTLVYVIVPFVMIDFYYIHLIDFHRAQHHILFIFKYISVFQNNSCMHVQIKIAFLNQISFSSFYLHNNPLKYVCRCVYQNIFIKPPAYRDAKYIFLSTKNFRVGSINYEKQRQC